ncbi:MAG: AsmA-like C-terminal region-containing protein [Flavobacteriaceae bacterium]
MKKILKISGITLLVLIILLIAAPFLFKGQIKDMVKRTINENVNAQVEFSNVSLSFIKSFPQAYVGINDLAIVNVEPFKGDTLVSAKEIAFSMSIKELFKTSTDGAIEVNSINIKNALLNLKTNAQGKANYDITKEKTETETTETTADSGGFTFDIDSYSISNSTIAYGDDTTKMYLKLSELNHEGSGRFSASVSELDTKTEALVSFAFDSVNYLNNNLVKLDALIDMDLTNNKYTFKDNKAYINKLPLEFKGFVHLLDDGQDMDITFENPGSDFKDFLALIPETYSKSIEGVQTSGTFKVKGAVKGKNTDTTIPAFDISIVSNNASFKYPDLPKRVENIIINTEIKNTTGNLDDTYVNINTLNFKIDEDNFKSSASIKNLTKNILVNANVDGVLNLANLTKAYPVALDSELSGLLKAKLHTNFDMNAIETNAYERIKSDGDLSLSGFNFASEDMANPVQISEASLTFNPSTVSLNSFKAKTGESDLNATGSIKNLLGFVLSNQTLQGNFNLNSNMFKLSDFMTEGEEISTANETASTPTETLKIPAFLDCTLNANANTVIYDNLTLKDVKGTLTIKDQQANLNNLTSSIFDGALGVSGQVSTKAEVPTFNLDLNINNFDIAKSFKGLELLQNLAPIASLFQGKLNSSLNLSGNLTNDFTPNLGSLSGNALAELLTTNISENNGPIVSKLQNSLSFIDFNKLNLKDLKTKIEFANGKVAVKPFQIKYNDIAIEIGGSHGFDKSIDYNAVFHVPAKYLGSEVTTLITKIGSEDAKNISIPVTANITGSFTNPSVKTDLTSGVTNLTNQLVEIQKQKLLNQGKDEANKLLDNLLNGKTASTDSTKTQQNNAVKDVLNDIIGGNKTTTDSTKTKQQTATDNVKNVLGGLLGGKKKSKDTTTVMSN